MNRFRKIQREMKKDQLIEHARSLKLPSETSWYTHHGCLRRVLDNAVVLKQLASHPVVDTVVRVKRTDFVQAVTDDSFWTRIKHAEKVLKPTSKLIGRMESDTGCLSDVYRAFMHIMGVWEGNNELSALVMERWAFLHTSSMGMAYFLDPKTLGGADMHGSDLVDTIDQLEEYAKLVAPVFDDSDITLEIEQFITRVQNSTDAERRLATRHSPSTYWNAVGRRSFPALTAVADIVFSIPTSQSASERMWSTYDFIHSKRRNRLDNDKVTKLVIVSENSLDNDVNISNALLGIESESDSAPDSPSAD